MTGPISDLSYRNYDGPLESPTRRWWVIARQMMRRHIRNKWYWVFSILSGGYYLLLMIVTFFVEQTTANAPARMGANGQNLFEEFMGRIIWKDQFMHGLSFGQIWFLSLALLVGIGSIANDNRANALLVYLSKPSTKRDYLFGKWMGIFLLMLIAAGIPVLFFILYGSLSYRHYGFLSDDPWMIPGALLATALTAAFHASLCVGFSSLFNQGRLAGATYAGIYFITNFFTVFMAGMHAVAHDEKMPQLLAALPTIQKLYYASIDGVNIGMVKAILRTDGSAWLGVNANVNMVPAPPLLGILLVAAGLSVLSLLLAWRRIRAVEIVG